VETEQSADEMEEMSKSLVTCTYEHNTPWGIEVSLSVYEHFIDLLCFNEHI
jgi:hypothetical protein